PIAGDNRASHQAADPAGIAHSFTESVFQEDLEALAGIEAAPHRIEANADIYAIRSLGEDPAVVRFHDSVEIDLHGIGRSLDSFKPTQDAVQCFSGPGRACECVVRAAADDDGAGFHVTLGGPDPDRLSVVNDLFHGGAF